MLLVFHVLLVLIYVTTSASGVTICSSSSILSTFTDPLCTSWCKVRLCSSGSCRSVLSGDDPTCQCESCGIGSWFGSSSSSDSNSNQPVSGQYYQAGSGGMQSTQDYRSNYDTGYSNGYDRNGYNQNGYTDNNNSGYRAATPGYGNANTNFNTNQQYANYNTNYRANQYASNVPISYGNAGQANYASGYQNLKKRR